MNSIKPQMWAMFCGVMFLMGCASAPQDSAHGESEVNDPIEGFNRSMWAVNYDYLDPYFVRPVSLAYVNYVPDPVRQGIANF